MLSVRFNEIWQYTNKVEVSVFLNTAIPLSLPHLQACGFAFLATWVVGTGLWQCELLTGVLVQQLLLWVLELGQSEYSGTSE